MAIYFGPQGNSAEFYSAGHRSTAEAPEWLSSLGLNCYEYAYGRGFRVGEESLHEIRENAESVGMVLSFEGLYFINLCTNARLPETEHFFDECFTVAEGLGALRMPFHPGTVDGLSREEALSNAMTNLKTMVERKNAAGLQNLILCPEIADETKDLGTLDEIIQLCSVDECIYPGMDFAHLNCITQGSLKTEADYAAVLDKVKEGCGEEKYRHMHIEFAHARWSDAGERELLTFADTEWGPFFEPLAKLIAERDLEPWCICDSRETQAEDAVKMMQMYEEAKKAIG